MSTKAFASQADLEEKKVTFEQLSEHGGFPVKRHQQGVDGKRAVGERDMPRLPVPLRRRPGGE